MEERLYRLKKPTSHDTNPCQLGYGCVESIEYSPVTGRDNVIPHFCLRSFRPGKRSWEPHREFYEVEAAVSAKPVS